MPKKKAKYNQGKIYESSAAKNLKKGITPKRAKAAKKAAKKARKY